MEKGYFIRVTSVGLVKKRLFRKKFFWGFIAQSLDIPAGLWCVCSPFPTWHSAPRAVHALDEHACPRRVLTAVGTRTHPLATMSRSASTPPRCAAHRVGVMPSSSCAFSSFLVASLSRSRRPSRAALWYLSFMAHGAPSLHPVPSEDALRARRSVRAAPRRVGGARRLFPGTPAS